MNRIRGGRFIIGVNGEQFALPIALQSLRLMRHQQVIETQIIISVADPLNLIGIILPGKGISSMTKEKIIMPL